MSALTGLGPGVRTCIGPGLGLGKSGVGGEHVFGSISICAAPASSVIIDNIVSVSYCQSDKLTCKLIRKLKLAC